MHQGMISVTPHDFEFSGDAREYFRIWIINLCLTIATLGIYSAWAKVRNTRYMYGNTRLSGASFEYLADPVTILKGRLIAVAIFVAYSAFGQFYPQQQAILSLLLLPLLPLVIVRSLRFSMRNTAYRNIRFNFLGSYGDAAFVFILLPILIPLTLGLMFPYWQYRAKKFVVDHTAYGATPFELNTTSGPFFSTYLKFVGIVLLAGLLMSFFSSLLPGAVGAILGPIAIFLAYSYAFALVNAEITNLIFNRSELEQHGFTSNLQPNALFSLYVTNALGIVLSLGLLIPWAQVRLAHYRAQCTQMQVAGDLDHFIAATEKDVSALGEELGDIFDLDVGL